jgi:hypothetical protein
MRLGRNTATIEMMLQLGSRILGSCFRLRAFRGIKCCTRCRLLIRIKVYLGKYVYVVVYCRGSHRSTN